MKGQTDEQLRRRQDYKWEKMYPASHLACTMVCNGVKGRNRSGRARKFIVLKGCSKRAVEGKGKGGAKLIGSVFSSVTIVEDLYRMERHQ